MEFCRSKKEYKENEGEVLLLKTVIFCLGNRPAPIRAPISSDPARKLVDDDDSISSD